ncbi:MAG: hypothetical protein AAGA25_17240 [Planctomycetota bacterium]
MKRMSVWLLGAVLGCMLSCGIVVAQDVAEEAALADVEAFYPLAVGNVWIFESEGGGPASTETIVESREIDGVTWFRLKGGVAEDPAQQVEEESWELWLANLPDGHADADMLPDEQTGEEGLANQRVYFRFPAKEGETYKLSADDDAPMMMRVISTETRVLTPAGAFDCIVYQEYIPGDLSYTFRAYVSPGVGVVKTETLLDGELIVDVLREYSLALPREE